MKRSHVFITFTLDGNPTEVFKAVTYSPSQLFAISQDSLFGDRIWDDLEECLQDGKPVCPGTKSSTEVSEKTITNGLVWDHFYTIVSFAHNSDGCSYTKR